MNMTNSSYTIYDLARDCNVSVATISRVINGSSSVSAKTREKVQTAIKEHNFTPNAFARGMNRMSTSIIAVFISDVTNPFFADIVKGIEDTCRRYGYRIILCITNNDMEQEKHELELMLQKQVDGFIICGSRPVNDTNAGYLQKISEKNQVIMVNSSLNGGEKLYSVLVDEKEAAKSALDTLLAKKQYKSLYVFGDSVWKTTAEKTQAAKEAALEKGIPFDESCIIQCQHTLESGREAAKSFLKQNPEFPSLVFCVSDQIAIGALKEFCEQKIEIPDQLGILGFSNISISSLVTPALTTVNQFMNDLGEQAANLFISSENGIVLKEKVFHSDYELVERQTT